MSKDKVLLSALEDYDCITGCGLGDFLEKISLSVISTYTHRQLDLYKKCTAAYLELKLTSNLPENYNLETRGSCRNVCFFMPS